MRIDFFCPRWGAEGIPWKTFLRDVKDAGYAGIEWFPFATEEDPVPVIRLLQEYDLKYSIVMGVKGSPGSFREYLLLLEQQLPALAGLGGGKTPPLFITAQTGREYFSASQVDACLSCCGETSKRTGVPVYQETHRNKWTYAAHVVPSVLNRHPDLQLTLDISHWFCVSESYLEDQQAAVELAIGRTRHVHARVGHIEGPQVTDPAKPEYAEALAQHLKIWDRWVEGRKKQGAESCTITPEFGPPPYMVFDGSKTAAWEEQWRLNLWMKSFLEKRYNNPAI